MIYFQVEIYLKSQRYLKEKCIPTENQRLEVYNYCIPLIYLYIYKIHLCANT